VDYNPKMVRSIVLISSAVVRAICVYDLLALASVVLQSIRILVVSSFFYSSAFFNDQAFIFTLFDENFPADE
jgi:hypothetical protein